MKGRRKEGGTEGEEGRREGRTEGEKRRMEGVKEGRSDEEGREGKNRVRERKEGVKKMVGKERKE